MSTKEEDFKVRFMTMMVNLREAGRTDNEAMWLMGSLAARLIDKSKKASWGDFRRGLTPRAYNKLLKDFESEGNAFHADGKMKPAYAIQALAMSVVAGTQKDEQVQEGNKLLDDLINFNVSVYRRNKHLETRVN